MSEKLSRRDLVAVLGAGMAASACSYQNPHIDLGNGESTDDLEMMSCDNKGQNPHREKPYGWNASNYPDEFSCKYIAILCVGLAKNWEVIINHANFDLQKNENDEHSRLIKATMAIDETWNNGKRKPFRCNSQHPPRKRIEDDSIDDHDNFGMFKFKSAIELFIYIYNADDSSMNKKISLKDDRLISFGSYLQEKNKRGGKRAARNCSYFHARSVKSSEFYPEKLKLFEKGELMRVENWCRDTNGNEIKNKEILHSMNVHFMVSNVGGNFVIPMVFDPDTGNGTGNEP